MKLSDPINDSVGGNGIIELIDFLVGSDSDSYPKVQKKRNINLWYRKVQQIIVGYMDSWLFEGDWAIHNFTTTCRTTGITIANDILTIEAVYVNYIVSNTNAWVRAKLVDPRRLALPPVNANDLFSKVTPRYWFTDSITIKIDPQPATQQTNGLKIRISDEVADLSADDDEPVFYEGCHPILAYGAALDYALVKAPDRVEDMKARLDECIHGDGGLKWFYTKRLREKEQRIVPMLPRMRL